MEGGATAQLIRTLQGAPDVRLTACALLPKQQIVPWEMNLVDRGQTKQINTNKINMFWGGEDGLGILADVTLLSKYPSLGQGHWKSRWCLGVRAGGCTAAAFKSSESSWTSGEQHGSS